MSTVVVVGDIFNGITIYGPFDSAKDARAWAHSEFADVPWWAVDLETP